MDSREQFETWWRSEMNIEVMDLHRCEFPMQKPDFVQPYACHETQRAWLAWQASAAHQCKDAARYRYLMSPAVYNGTLGVADGWIDFEFKDEAQEAIDAEMLKQVTKC